MLIRLFKVHVSYVTTILNWFAAAQVYRYSYPAVASIASQHDEEQRVVHSFRKDVELLFAQPVCREYQCPR